MKREDIESELVERRSFAGIPDPDDFGLVWVPLYFEGELIGYDLVIPVEEGEYAI